MADQKTYSDRVKGAIKTALAMVLAYGIALSDSEPEDVIVMTTVVVGVDRGRVRRRNWWTVCDHGRLRDRWMTLATPLATRSRRLPELPVFVIPRSSGG